MCISYDVFVVSNPLLVKISYIGFFFSFFLSSSLIVKRVAYYLEGEWLATRFIGASMNNSGSAK